MGSAPTVTIRAPNVTLFNLLKDFGPGIAIIPHPRNVERLFRGFPVIRIKNDWICLPTFHTGMAGQIREQFSVKLVSSPGAVDDGPLLVCRRVRLIVTGAITTAARSANLVPQVVRLDAEGELVFRFLLLTRTTNQHRLRSGRDRTRTCDLLRVKEME